MKTKHIPYSERKNRQDEKRETMRKKQSRKMKYDFPLQVVTHDNDED